MAQEDRKWVITGQSSFFNISNHGSSDGGSSTPSKSVGVNKNCRLWDHTHYSGSVNTQVHTDITLSYKNTRTQ